MKGVDTIARIRREFFTRGRAIKDIVRDLHVFRNTVRKVIRSGATAFAYEREVQPLPKLGPWRDDLDRMLTTNAGKSARERLTLIRIYEALRGLGYEGGYDAVRRYAKIWKRERASVTAQAFVPLIFAPGVATSDRRIAQSRRARNEESARAAIRKPISKPPPIRSTKASLMCRSTDTAGYWLRNGGSRGATCITPNDIGAASRTKPQGSKAPAIAWTSAASPSDKIRAALSFVACPASVRASLREVRWNRRAPMRASKRLTAFETVAFYNPSSVAARLNEPVSNTLEKMAHASKSGRRIRHVPETVSFYRFCFTTVT